MNITQSSSGNASTRRRLGLLVGVVMLGKMGWWLYWGTLLEIDSLGYLHLQATLYHPPLYTVFNWLVMQVGRAVDAVVVAQSLLYSLSVAVWLWRMVQDRRWQLGLAVALALEPCSGKLACTVMAETLFLSLLLLAFVALPALGAARTQRWVFAALWAGLLLGLAYMTRYAAPVFLVAVVGAMFLQRLPWQRILVAALVMLAAFQMELLPLRAYYQHRFDTWRFNAFSDLSLWNTAAYLYPGSPLASQPATDFERYLSALPAADFTLEHTWHTNHIFHDSLAFQRYVREQEMGTGEILAAARSAGHTGRKLLLAAPMRHIQEFVIPNAARPFHVRDRIHSDLLPAHIEARIFRHTRPVHDYVPWAWWGVFALLVGATVLQVVYRKRLPSVAGFLLLACWLYLAGIAGLAVIFLRFVYVLGPLVVLAVGMQWGALLKARAGASP